MERCAVLAGWFSGKGSGNKKKEANQLYHGQMTSYGTCTTRSQANRPRPEAQRVS